jgi:hypothetical protein
MYKLRKIQLPILSEINPIFEEIFDLTTSRTRLNEYWRLTDYFLLDRMNRVLLYLDSLPAHNWVNQPNFGNEYSDVKHWGIVADLHKLLKTVLLRDKTWLVSFWKRPDDYERFARGIYALSDGNAKRLNDALSARFYQIIREAADRDGITIGEEQELDRYFQLQSEMFTGKFTDEIEREVNAHLRGKHCRVRAHYLSSFSPTPRAMRLLGDHLSQHNLATLSPSIAALGTAWQALPQLWLFQEFYAYGETGENVPVRDYRRDVPPQSLYEDVGLAIRGWLDVTSGGGGVQSSAKRQTP